MNLVEHLHYMPGTICPVCMGEAEPIASLPENYERLGCSNEYYHHIKKGGKHFLKKRRGPKRDFNRL